MTKAEQKRIDRMRPLGCVACAYLDIVNVGTDVHHILDGGIRMGHGYTILLCPGHHRGVWTPEQIEIIPVEKRIAISDGRPLFYAVYGSERELWQMVQLRLKLPILWPMSKILPRSVA